MDSDITFEDDAEPLEYPTWQDELFARIIGEVDYKKAYSSENFTSDIEHALSKLSQREQFVIKRRFIDGLTLEEIGKMLNVQRERVRQIEAKALRRLRTPALFKYICYGYNNVEMDKYIDNRLYEIRAEFQKGVNDKNLELINIVNSIKELSKPSERKQYRELFEAFCKERGFESIDEVLAHAPVLNIAIEDLNFSVRTYNCLKRRNANTLDKVIELAYDNELHRVRNLGQKSLQEIVHTLIEYGADETILMENYGYLM